MTVEREDDNRQLVLEWFIYPEFPNRVFFQLDGASSPRFYEYHITFREAGEWTVRATLVKSLKQESTEYRVQVIGPQDRSDR